MIILLLPKYPAYGQTPRLQFAGTQQLPGSGLSLRLLRQAQAVPLPSPEFYTYEMTDGERTWREERIDPYEHWRREQHAGEWVDAHGNRLRLATARFPLPAFPHRHILLEQYRNLLPSPTNRWTEDDLRQWVTDYSGHAIREWLPLRSVPRSLDAAVEIRFSRQPHLSGWLFRPKALSIRYRQEEVPVFLAILSFHPDLDPEQAVEQIRSGFLPSIEAMRMTANEGAVSASTVFEGRDGPAPARHDAAYQASLNAVRNSIQNLRDWWYVETTGYILLSNLGSAHRFMIRELQDILPVFRDAYQTLVPPARPIQEVSVIRLFASGEEYQRYVGPDYAWSGGLWMPSRRELVIRPLESRNRREEREQVLRTVQHEAFHQYLFHAFDGRQDIPAWFNEGYAVLFEHAEIRAGRLRFLESDSQAAYLEQLAANNALNLRRLMQLSYAEFYAVAAPEHVRRTHYATAWGLVYYLLKGTDSHPDPAYGQLLPHLAATLAEGGHTHPAMHARLRTIDLTQLETAMAEFWTSRNQRAAARRKQVFAR